MSLWQAGSSPHARGAHVNTFGSDFNSGIIPACAGSTTYRDVQYLCRVDHPRMRGEHTGMPVAKSSPRGSSPHARGAQARHCPARSKRRIIPACAGSTPFDDSACVHIRDHPRMRGEHNLVKLAVYVLKGSSPHARGAHFVSAHVTTRPGIIPACAGSTDFALAHAIRLEDHPRMRGEHVTRG